MCELFTRLCTPAFAEFTWIGMVITMMLVCCFFLQMLFLPLLINTEKSSNFIFIPSKGRSIGYRLWDNRWFVWIVYWLWCNVYSWKHLFSTRMSSAIPRDVAVNQYTAAALVHICIYCETHKHFNYLYKFQVILKPNILMIAMNILLVLLVVVRPGPLSLVGDWPLHLSLLHLLLPSLCPQLKV